MIIYINLYYNVKRYISYTKQSYFCAVTLLCEMYSALKTETSR